MGQSGRLGSAGGAGRAVGSRRERGSGAIGVRCKRCGAEACAHAASASSAGCLPPCAAAQQGPHPPHSLARPSGMLHVCSPESTKFSWTLLSAGSRLLGTLSSAAHLVVWSAAASAAACPASAAATWAAAAAPCSPSASSGAPPPASTSRVTSACTPAGRWLGGRERRQRGRGGSALCGGVPCTGGVVRRRAVAPKRQPCQTCSEPAPASCQRTRQSTQRHQQTRQRHACPCPALRTAAGAPLPCPAHCSRRTPALPCALTAGAPTKYSTAPQAARHGSSRKKFQKGVLSCVAKGEGTRPAPRSGEAERRAHAGHALAAAPPAPWRPKAGEAIRRSSPPAHRATRLAVVEQAHGAGPLLADCVPDLHHRLVTGGGACAGCEGRRSSGCKS